MAVFVGGCTGDTPGIDGDIGVSSTALIFYPTADAQLDRAYPNINYGTTTSLRVDGSPFSESVLLFQTKGIKGRVKNATLRLYVSSNGTPNGPKIFISVNNQWVETSVTYDTRPNPLGPALDDKGAVSAGTWVSYNLMMLFSQLTSDVSFSVVLLPDSDDGVVFSSRESAHPPMLVLEPSWGEDGGSTADLAVSDALRPVDLGAAQDASLQPDLKVSTDALSAMDLAAPRDLLPPVDLALPPVDLALSPVDLASGGGSETLMTIVVAGDVAQAGRTDRARSCATRITTYPSPIQAVLLAGDNARLGTGVSGISLFSYYDTYYGPASEANWGQFNTITFPQLGNHEYGETNAQGYFDYFAARMAAIKAAPGYGGEVDTVGKGYYSFNLNGWHFVSLNSEVSKSAGSPQEVWLRGDLAAHATMPIVGLWHRPRYACGGAHTGATDTQALWADLYDAGADFAFNGHDHFYQRWQPLDKASSAVIDTAKGLTEIIVGDTGVGPHSVCTTVDPRIAKQIGGEAGMGVLFLTIGSRGSWSLEYRLASDGSVFDSASGLSHHPT